MAYLDHIDPGNSGGSVVIPLPSYIYTPRVIDYPCQVCDEIFVSEDDRLFHRYNKHPIRRPYIYIKGVSPRLDEIKVSTILTCNDIRFEDTDSIQLDDIVYTDIASAINDLVSRQSGRRTLKLIHQNYPVDYRIHFNQVDEVALYNIEIAFFEAFSSTLVLGNQLQLFDERVKSLDANGLSYAGGLGCYITGIMVKDGVGETSLLFDQYLTKLGEAQDKLEGIERPLAQSVIAAIGFILNDFSYRNGDTNIPSLELAKSFFRTGHFPKESRTPIGTKKIPIDAITEVLIGFCTSDWLYQSAKINDIEAMFRAKIISAQDKLKLAFLLWIMSRLTKKKKETEMYRKFLINSHPFGELISSLKGSQ